jgi:hypothetical protein
MQAQSWMKLWRQGPVNSFLLCTVLAKQTRRLGRLMPDRLVPELITIALKNCADYELTLDVDAGVPGVVREEAMQIGRLARRPEPAVTSNPGRSNGGEVADTVSASRGQGAAQSEPDAEGSLLGKSTTGSHISLGGPVDITNFGSNLQRVQRETSMSNSDGMDLTRLR